MNALAAILTWAGLLLSQDGATTTAKSLTDPDLVALGALAVDQLDANPGAEALEKALQEKLQSLRAGSGSSAKESDPSDSKTKGKKKKKGAKKPPAPAPDTLKSGLTEADRLAFGKLVVSELDAGHKGEELSGVLKKELERLRAERAKATSEVASDAKKKKKKAAQ